jgi:hypothetical protein
MKRGTLAWAARDTQPAGSRRTAGPDARLGPVGPAPDLGDAALRAAPAGRIAPAALHHAAPVWR